jgi:hypothetical protein
MSKDKNDRTAIRTAVIGQKGPFFVVENEKDKMIMTGHCNQDKIEKKVHRDSTG